MDLSDLDEVLTGQEITGGDALAAMVLIAVGIGAYFLVGKVLRSAIGRVESIPGEIADVAARLVGVLVVWVFVAWALNILGVTTGWLTLLVVTLLVIAFVFAKPFFDGMISSVVVASSAISVGDEIAVDGVLGEVQDVAKRSTVLQTRDGRLVYIPNTEIVEKTVTVFTALEERRSTIEITVAFDTDLEAFDRIVEQALMDVAPIRRVGSIRARLFDEGISLAIQVWHGPAISDQSDAVDAAIRALQLALIGAGIEIAPTMSIRLDPNRQSPG